MSGNPHKWSANPTAAVVVSVITAFLGIWMVRGDTSETATAFGWMLIVVGIVGGAANLYIRHRWRNPN